MEMSKIIIGAMRFPDRERAVGIIRAAIDCGFNYIDTCPCYCRSSEEENSESWVGEAVNHSDYRDRVMVSTKCTPGNGGLLLGDFAPERGSGARTVEEVKQIFRQSQKRTGIERFEYYHLWTTHTMEQFSEAMKPGGWYDGVMQMRDFWGTLGVTTHADNGTIIKFLESGKFSVVTIPLNVVNTTRMKVVDYCSENGIKVIAMNPFAGGFLAKHERLKELALRFLMCLENVHILIGFSAVEEVAYAKSVQESQVDGEYTMEAVLQEVADLLDCDAPRCTACGYCQPCPQGINVGASLSYYNVYKYLHVAEARKMFNGKQWEDGLRLDRCNGCGSCEERCPNNLPVREIIADAKKILYKK